MEQSATGVLLRRRLGRGDGLVNVERIAAEIIVSAVASRSCGAVGFAVVLRLDEVEDGCSVRFLVRQIRMVVRDVNKREGDGDFFDAVERVVPPDLGAALNFFFEHRGGVGSGLD